MAGFFRKLFGSSSESVPMSRTYGLKDDALYSDNADILDGLQFVATLQLRTPLSVLRHHGELFKGPYSRAPKYGTDADGIWVPKVSFAEFGLSDPPESEVASHLGPMRPSEYVPFLVAFREIVETHCSHAQMVEAIQALPSRSPLFRSFFERHRRNDPDFPMSFFYEGLTALTGVGHATAKRLYEAGFHTCDDVRSASDQSLLAIKGIGPRLVARIKNSSG